MYRLYGFFTQNSMKTLYVLCELGVEFDFRYVDLFRGENRTEEFRGMNPLGKVPVLEHDGEFLFESGAICRYLANVESSPLYPEPRLERARVDQWLDYFSCHLGRWLTTLWFELVLKPNAGLGEPDQRNCDEARKFALQQLKVLDEVLEGRQWLANDNLSIADLFGFAYVEQCPDIDISLTEYPGVETWYGRVEGRESIGEARGIPPGYGSLEPPSPPTGAND